ncbi:MAG: GNAT family N-acetyltransferase [Thermoplasmatota archaeon]
MNLLENFREYNKKKDREAVYRIWYETGWLKKEQRDAMDLFLEGSKEILVADINGEPECLVTTVPAVIQYQENEIPLSCITAVTTSRIARKQGFASKLAAKAVARDASEGFIVSGLGMFEQGFYNRLGFGTGSYEHWYSFDPSTVDVDIKPRVPKRITVEDWEDVYENLENRMKKHGYVTFTEKKGTKGMLKWSEKSFGLGYYDDSGKLSHHVWFGVDDIEQGPYWVRLMAYTDYDQFLELMGLIKNLGDQVKLITMKEPSGIQLQDLLKEPFRRKRITNKSKFENKLTASAYWQVRINDLQSCLKNTSFQAGEVKFDLKLHDPIEELLERDSPWKGISGRYVVNLGEECWAEERKDASLPTLEADVGAFSRMWLGVRPASGLAVTDNLSGPKELLERLDKVICLPEPHPDWDL